MKKYANDDNPENYQLKSNYAPCLREGCKRDTYGGSRGLCINHYAVLQAKVKRGRTTWDELEQKGLTNPLLSKEECNFRKSKNTPLERVWSTKLSQFVFEKRNST